MRFLRLFTLFLCLLPTLIAHATHIVGGQLDYECLGNNRFVVKLTVVRDCWYGVPPFDDPASIGVFGSDNQLIQELRPRPIGDDTLDLQLTDPCLVVPPDVCYHRTSYTDTISLPFRAGGYQLVYQRCCRNNTIDNIVRPLGTGATFYNFISEAALLGCNNSAIFTAWPPPLICGNKPLIFDHSASDTDGDSLVYSLCVPLDGADSLTPRPQPPFNPPYQPVVWQPPYNTANMLGGTPLTINPQTGLLTAFPTVIGQFVIGICVEEYRNGVLI